MMPIPVVRLKTYGGGHQSPLGMQMHEMNLEIGLLLRNKYL
jgi:hypothetical protein